MSKDQDINRIISYVYDNLENIIGGEGDKINLSDTEILNVYRGYLEKENIEMDRDKFHLIVRTLKNIFQSGSNRSSVTLILSSYLSNSTKTT